ncbi:hypothetical protein LCGC14_2220900, partial [marine sediment metagenome]
KYKCKSLGLRKEGKFCKFSHDEVSKFKNNQEFNSRITGHLLGDGSLNTDISFTLRNTKKDYIIDLQSFFNSITRRENKIITIPSYITSISNIATKCKESYSCTFTCSSIFRPLKELWYKNKKTVPKSLNLTPLICNRWYCDDGSLYINQKKGILRIILYTDSFALSDVEFLILSLTNSIGIHPTKKIRTERDEQYVIVISGQDVLSFLDYIKACPVPSFLYKWDLKSYKKYSINCHSCNQIFEYGGFVSYRKFCNNCKRLKRTKEN